MTVANPRKWSYSRFTSYECPRRYHEHYVKHSPKTHCSELGQFGTGFHEFAEAYALWCQECGNPLWFWCPKCDRAHWIEPNTEWRGNGDEGGDSSE